MCRSFQDEKNTEYKSNVAAWEKQHVIVHPPEKWYDELSCSVPPSFIYVLLVAQNNGSLCFQTVKLLGWCCPGNTMLLLATKIHFHQTFLSIRASFSFSFIAFFMCLVYPLSLQKPDHAAHCCKSWSSCPKNCTELREQNFAINASQLFIEYLFALSCCLRPISLEM